MIEKTAEDYSKLLNVKLDEKVNGVNQIVEDMLTRLEEFENLIILVQQERCNAIGITGKLPQTLEHVQEIKNICSKVDLLEKMVHDADVNITALEGKVKEAEEQHKLNDNTNKIKKFIMPLFKKPVKSQQSTSNEEVNNFVADEYFTNKTNTC